MGTKYISTNFPIRLSALKLKKYLYHILTPWRNLPRKAGFASLRLRQLRRCVSNEAYYPLAKSIKNPLAAKTLLMDLSMANAGTLIIFKLIFSQVKTKKKWNGTVDKYPNSNELQRKQQQQPGGTARKHVTFLTCCTCGSQQTHLINKWSNCLLHDLIISGWLLFVRNKFFKRNPALNIERYKKRNKNIMRDEIFLMWEMSLWAQPTSVCPAATTTTTTTLAAATAAAITTMLQRTWDTNVAHVSGISLKAFSQFFFLILILYLVFFFYIILGFVVVVVHLAANFSLGKYFFKCCFGFLLIGGDMCCRY